MAVARRAGPVPWEMGRLEDVWFFSLALQATGPVGKVAELATRAAPVARAGVCRSAGPFRLGSAAADAGVLFGKVVLVAVRAVPRAHGRHGLRPGGVHGARLVGLAPEACLVAGEVVASACRAYPVARLQVCRGHPRRVHESRVPFAPWHVALEAFDAAAEVVEPTGSAHPVAGQQARFFLQGVALRAMEVGEVIFKVAGSASPGVLGHGILGKPSDSRLPWRSGRP
mmetsp:Transcript_17240/g.48092  ORF Transcript_17240/g.48092 Transcript_17240/m.48092 type:complete len:227 (+) Transcript_17240:158-838(+)